MSQDLIKKTFLFLTTLLILNGCGAAGGGGHEVGGILPPTGANNIVSPNDESPRVLSATGAFESIDNTSNGTETYLGTSN